MNELLWIHTISKSSRAFRNFKSGEKSILFTDRQAGNGALFHI